MLYPNGQRIFCYPGRHVSGALAASGAMAYGGLQGARINRVVSEVYSKTLGAVPSGYSGKAWLLAVTAGGIAGFSGLSISPTGAGVLGMPGEGAASLVFTVADADGQLISSGSGSAALSIAIADALLTASISGTGTAALTITVAPAALGAIADIEAAASFVITGSLVPYAVGSMSGSTADTSVLTVDAIAAGVLAAALAAPIRANIKQVNDATVTGTGIPGNEWGPV